MRTFIAIELPQEIKAKLSAIQNELKSALPKISWVMPNNLHLTLKFLGDVSDKQIASITQIITEIAESTKDFKIKLTTLGVFPNIPAAKIIWIGTDKVEAELKQVVKQLETKIAELGKPKEKRAFSLHITLGRIKLQINSTDLENSLNQIKSKKVLEDLEFNARKITLFESTLSSQGPTYTLIKGVNFKIN